MILCGDAACFIDPLFSTGVHLALSSGLMAAAYVATALSDAELAAAAGARYQRLYASSTRTSASWRGSSTRATARSSPTSGKCAGSFATIP